MIQSAIADVPALMAYSREHIVIRKTAFEDLIREHGPLSVYELQKLHFGELESMQVYLAMSETVAYMDLVGKENSF